jgi:type IV pilus assembly protein PilA
MRQATRNKTFPRDVQQAFTLIELMIVVAIIGILAAIATAAYENYVARAQMTEALSLSGGLKTIVGRASWEKGALTGVNSGDDGIPAAASYTGKYVSQVEVVDGVITATIKATANTRIANKTLTLAPTPMGGSLMWACSSNAEPKYLPSDCR